MSYGITIITITKLGKNYSGSSWWNKFDFESEVELNHFNSKISTILCHRQNKFLHFSMILRQSLSQWPSPHRLAVRKLSVAWRLSQVLPVFLDCFSPITLINSGFHSCHYAKLVSRRNRFLIIIMKPTTDDRSISLWRTVDEICRFRNEDAAESFLMYGDFYWRLDSVYDIGTKTLHIVRLFYFSIHQ